MGDYILILMAILFWFVTYGFVLFCCGRFMYGRDDG